MSARASFNRRRFLNLAGVGTAALATGCAARRLGVGPQAPTTAPESAKTAAGDFVPDLELELSATRAQASILPGRTTSAFAYQGRVLAGDPGSLQPISESYLGPIMRLRQGQKVRINFVNELPEVTNVHWHGLRVPASMDGHPDSTVAPGGRFTYEFEVIDRAGPYWFHPHPDGRTGLQVYGGLAGLVYVSDDEEMALDWQGKLENVPLIIQDRVFDQGNQLVYGPMMGNEWLGDTILVNGRPDYVLPVATKTYRLRLLNGSNARSYKLAWASAEPLTVIATDGGLLAAPVSRGYVMLAPAERVDLWVDFSRYPVGSELELRSLEFDAGHSGMMGGGGMMDGMIGGSLPDGAPLSLLRVRVEQEAPASLSLAATLSSLPRYDENSATNATAPRRFLLDRQMMAWTINGRVYQGRAVAADETVGLGDLELWEFANNDTMAHPMHIHGVQFQVLRRQVTGDARAWQGISAGYVDEGWKDTVMVMPGERVLLAMRFGPYAGTYVYHCHILEHEDTGMMRSYTIGESGPLRT